MANWSGATFGGFDPALSWGAERPYLRDLRQDAANDEYWLQSRLADLQFDYSKQGAKWSALNLPSLERQGLESAGYNPLLAIGGSHFSNPIGGVSVSGSVKSPSIGSVSSSAGNPLAIADALASIDVKRASAEKTRSEIGVNAWRPAHFNSSEAMGLGANALGSLGLHVNSSSSEGYTLFVNPIEKKILNPQNGKVFIFGHANSAQDVREGEVISELLDAKPAEDLKPAAKSQGVHQPLSSFFDPGMGFTF